LILYNKAKQYMREKDRDRRKKLMNKAAAAKDAAMFLLKRCSKVRNIVQARQTKANIATEATSGTTPPTSSPVTMKQKRDR
jgi:hypothetical protein